MMYVQLPLSLRNVEDLLHERGIDVCHESLRLSSGADCSLPKHNSRKWLLETGSYWIHNTSDTVHTEGAIQKRV